MCYRSRLGWIERRKASVKGVKFRDGKSRLGNGRECLIVEGTKDFRWIATCTT